MLLDGRNFSKMADLPLAGLQSLSCLCCACFHYLKCAPFGVEIVKNRKTFSAVWAATDASKASFCTKSLPLHSRHTKAMQKQPKTTKRWPAKKNAGDMPHPRISNEPLPSLLQTAKEATRNANPTRHSKFSENKSNTPTSTFPNYEGGDTKRKPNPPLKIAFDFGWYCLFLLIYWIFTRFCLFSFVFSI